MKHHNMRGNVLVQCIWLSVSEIIEYKAKHVCVWVSLNHLSCLVSFGAMRPVQNQTQYVRSLISQHLVPVLRCPLALLCALPTFCSHYSVPSSTICSHYCVLCPLSVLITVPAFTICSTHFLPSSTISSHHYYLFVSLALSVLTKVYYPPLSVLTTLGSSPLVVLKIDI